MDVPGHVRLVVARARRSAGTESRAEIADEAAGIDEGGEQVAALRLEHGAAHHQAAQEHAVTETNSSAPRPVRFSRKCPPPGISQPKATAGAQALMGGIGCRCSFSFAISLSLAVERAFYGSQDLAPDHLVGFESDPTDLSRPGQTPGVFSLQA